MKSIISLLSKLKRKDKNFNKYLRRNSTLSESKIVQLSYDFQSGDYIKKYNPEIERKNLTPMINEINKTTNVKTLLDFGAGELTRFSYLLKKLFKNDIKFFACDISFNRLFLGSQLLGKKKLLNSSINIFCNDYFKLPFLDNSIDVIVTHHSIEPNKNNAKKIINELYRVARKKLILQEPNYDIACKSGKKRMLNNNYVVDLSKILKKNGFRFEIIKSKFNLNDLNPASLYVIKKNTRMKKNCEFICNESKKNLSQVKNFYFSNETGTVYPILNNITIFNKNFIFIKESI